MANPGKSRFGLPYARRAADEGEGANGGSARLRAVRDFGANPGDLAMKAYAPAGLTPGAPLVVVLHGCTQLAGGYDGSARWTMLADQHRFAVLYPEQRRANNPNLCFSWFQPDDVTRGQGEVASIRQMIETMVTRHKLDRTKVFVTGLSAGGAMAAALLATYPEVFAGGAIVAGLPYGAANGVAEAFSAMGRSRERSHEDWGDLVRAASPHKGPWPKIAVWHGTADATVTPQNAEEIVKQWADVHGLELGTMRQETRGRRTRRVWGDGEVEVNLIDGMAHGVPLDAASGEAPGPYMLDVGVSQAKATLAFWGIAATPETAIRAAVQPAPSKPEPKAERPKSTPALTPVRTPEPLRPERRSSRSGFAGRMDPSPRVSEKRGFDVEAVIKKALRAAGLMK